MSAPPPGAARAAVASAGVFAGLFLAIGAHMPFWPVWLSERGLSEAQVGLLLGAAVGVRVAAGVAAPWFADATGQRRLALVLLGVAGAALFALMAPAASPAVLVALTLASGAAMAGAIPISDALCAAAARRHGFDYARVRASGSAAFLLANLGCGWAVAQWGADAALWWIVASLLAMALTARLHPGGARDGRDARPRLAEALALARRRPSLCAALASAMVQASHAPLYAYGSLMWKAQGVDSATIGALWAFGVALEVALMLTVGGRLVARLGPAGAFALAGCAALARWLAMAAEPSGAWLWFWQASHALSFAPAHLAMIAFVGAAAPERLTASAQGLIGPGIGGTAMAAATFGAAALYPAYGPGMFWLGAAMAALGLAAAFALSRSWDGGAIVPPKRP